jgi:hypothetical protein
MENLICKSRAAAITALETLAADMGKGTKQAALRAVRDWVEQNTEPEQSQDEIRAELERIFKGDEHDRLGREWKDRGGLPPDGARASCLWDAKTQTWKPEFPPPETVA